MRFIVQRVLRLFPVLFAVTVLTFLMINLLPGSPINSILGLQQSDPVQVERLKRELKLDDSIPVRYGDWISKAVLKGDLGRSYRSRVPVRESLAERLPLSLTLMFYAQVMSLLIAIPLGILTAYRQGGALDRATTAGAFGLLSMPSFMLGIILIFVFAVRFRWFKATGWVPIGDNLGDHFRSAFRPALTLSVGQIAIYTRLLRTDMIATLQEDFITMARAKGMPTRRILLRHALRPSSLSLITIAGINIGQLIGGALIVEQLFALPGVGRLIVEGILARDYLVVQGGVVVVCVGFVLVNFFVDMLYALLDPRIRHARSLA